MKILTSNNKDLHGCHLKKRSHFFLFHFIYYQNNFILTMDSDRNKTINHRAQNMLDASPPPHMLAAVAATADSQSQQQQQHQEPIMLAAATIFNSATPQQHYHQYAIQHPLQQQFQAQPVHHPQQQEPTPVLNNDQYQFVPQQQHQQQHTLAASLRNHQQ